MSWKHFLMSFSLACSWRNLKHILGAAPPWRTSLLKGCQEAPLTHSVTLVSPNICCLCQLCVFWSKRSPAPYHSFSYVLWHVNSSCSRSHRDSAFITSPQMESATADNDKISWRALESCWDSSLQSSWLGCTDTFVRGNLHIIFRSCGMKHQFETFSFNPLPMREFGAVSACPRCFRKPVSNQ